MRKEELEYAFEKLNSAFIKLKDGSNAAKDELEKDGVIQRFEFTFELLWKTIKIFLENNGIMVKTPREALRESFKIGWIFDEKTFLNMLEDRNKTSHIYDKDTAEEIFGRIKNDYVGVISLFLEKIKPLC